ncbi:MAG: class I SAM-dependent methyltransferase [Ruminococcus sp.]|nr:class I SAM-dependent methyltransferase [Ruminococcus sp.]
MSNPWEEISIDDYENHMSLDSVFQLQAMNEMMKEQFNTYPVKSVMILGIAGGNGLEHIDKQVFNKVYGVDINNNYLKVCLERYPELHGKLETICADLTIDKTILPYADLIVANLFIEYVGCECFQKIIEQIKPKYVSCVIQINTDDSFVSDSPYIHAFDHLYEVHHQIKENALIDVMSYIGYKKERHIERELPNGKKLIRIDFSQ